MLASITYNAYAQQIKAKQEVIDCGQVVFRNPVTAEFQLINSGQEAFSISDIKTSCGCTKVSYNGNVIPSDSNIIIKATYDAKQMGHFEKQIYVYGNASKEPLELTIRGVVVREIETFNNIYPFTLGELQTDLNNIEFDDVNRGDRPIQEIHVKNNSGKSAKPVVMHLPNYLSAEVSPSSIAPGHSGIVKITLDSHKLRDFGLTQTSVYLGHSPGDKISSEKEISVSAVLLPSFENMTDAALAMTPKMKLSTNELNLGSFDGKKTKKGEIIIENNGKSTLDIRSLQIFTTGIKVSVNKTHIAPGEQAKLKITADEKQLRTARSKPRVLMITNDPENSKVIINISVKM